MWKHLYCVLTSKFSPTCIYQLEEKWFMILLSEFDVKRLCAKENKGKRKSHEKRL